MNATMAAVRTRSLDVAACMLLVLVGAAMPWGGSGEVDRSSFELVRYARRLDVLDGIAATLAVAWLALPLVAALVVVAGWSGRRGLALAGATSAAVFGAGLAVAVSASPLLERSGIRVTMVGAGALAIVWFMEAWRRVVGSRDRRTGAVNHERPHRTRR
jgi:hypothetical protein